MGSLPNSTIYYKLVVPVDATLGCISTVLSVMVLVLYLQRAGWKKSTDLIFMNIAIVDLTNSINFICHCIYILDPTLKKALYAAFWIQANTLNTSLYFTLLLGILKLYLLYDPFSYSTKVKHVYIVVLTALIWIGSTIDCYLRYGWAPYFKYQAYVTGVVLRIILIVATNATGVGIMARLAITMRSTDDGKVEDEGQRINWRRSSFYTSAILSFTYLLCHSYYLYVLMIWVVKGACTRAKTENPWVYFTGCGPESLSMGHISLLLYSIITNVIILNQQALRSQMGTIVSTIRSRSSTSTSGSGNIRLIKQNKYANQKRLSSA